MSASHHYRKRQHLVSAAFVGAVLVWTGLAIGVAIGLVGAYYVGQAMEQQLFNVAPTDPRVIAGVIVALSVIALVAVAIPATRASRVDPTSALNS